MNKKIIGIILVVLVIFGITRINFQTPSQYNSVKLEKNEVAVSFKIDVTTLSKDKTLVKPELQKYIPENGIIFENKSLAAKKDATVFDVLQEVVRQNKIQLEYEGANENAFNMVQIKGINNIYEFSAGKESGWMYTVNGKFLEYGMSQAKINSKDDIRIVYTTNYGCDIDSTMDYCKK